MKSKLLLLFLSLFAFVGGVKASTNGYWAQVYVKRAATNGKTGVGSVYVKGNSDHNNHTGYACNYAGYPKIWSEKNANFSFSADDATGYTFKGWKSSNSSWENLGSEYLSKDKSFSKDFACHSDNENVSNGSDPQKVEKHYVLGIYEPNQYTITLKDRGNTIEQQTPYYDAAYSLPTPTRTGYELDGWYQDNTKWDMTGTYTTASDVELTAVWRAKKYNITLDENNGIALRTMEATYDAAKPAITDPVYAGYDFAGWYDENGVLWDNSGNYTIDGPVTLKAKWTRKLQVKTIPYATFYLDKNYIMPDGVTGSYVSAVSGKTSGKLTVTDVYFAGDIVPANVPLLLSANIDDYILEITDEEGTIVEGNNCLHGQLTAGTIQKVDGDNYYYKLAVGSKGSANEGKPGFYWGVDGGGVFSLTGNNRAYLVLPKEANVKSFSFENGLETAITDVVEVVNSNDAVYNVAGQRVTSATRGMYIKNGKKYLIK